MAPSVFILQGSPMHAREAGPAGEAWKALGQRMGKPRAILIASAHWETDLPMLTGSANRRRSTTSTTFPSRSTAALPHARRTEIAQRARPL